MLLALLLALPLDSAKVCAARLANYKPPAAAAKLGDTCEDGQYCYVELAEKYANGEGVKRDYDLAEFFLCMAEEELAPVELESMLEHLQEIRGGKSTRELSFCDHTSSGYAATFCAHRNWEEMMPRLDARIDALRRKVAAKTRFDGLRKRGNDYVSAESTRIGEQSRGGTGYSAIVLGSEVDEKQLFVETLERYSTQRAPAASAAEEKQADRELNDAYRGAHADIESDDETIADWPELLRKAQCAWLAYRDAWAAYYVERWKGSAAPDVLRREIVTQLSRDRAAQLRGE
jgi:uncharacterized protein YecT (DUF1311 family)